MLRFIKYSFLLAAFFHLQMLSQNESGIKGKAFITRGSVLLRWIPTNKSVLSNGIKYGYKIERTVVKDSLALYNSVLVFESILTQYSIKPLLASDSLWKNLISHNSNAALIYNTIYPSQKNQNKTSEMKKADEIGFGLFLLACDLNVDAAKAAGLFFKDSTIQNDKKYCYRISFFDSQSQLKMYEERIYVDASKLSALPVINNLSGKFFNKKSELTWNVSGNKSTYTAYIIERSEDSATFVRINQTPFIQLYSQYEKNKTEASFKDSLPENGKYYYYRIRGITHFGVIGPHGNCIKGKGKNVLSAYPIFDTVYTKNNKCVFLEWRMPQTFNYNELKCYSVSKSNADQGPYKIINSKPIDVTNPVFIDSLPMFTNYYKILAINNDGDTSYSFSWMVQLEDRDPPAIPIGLNGSVDGTGVVKLNWKKNNEEDLKGYRIFRCNSLTEELTEVTNEILKDTVYRDSIVVRTLSKNVYYSITAVDNLFNNSDYSKPILLKRPDIIPPVAPIFMSISGTDSSVFIRWINSSSDDVFSYLLTKKEVNSNKTDTVGVWSFVDTTSFVNDEKIDFGKTYVYILTAFDDSQNFARTISKDFLYEPGVRPKIKNISSKVDIDKRSVVLNWVCNNNDIYSYTIYKCKKGEDMRLYKTIRNSNNFFEDHDLKANNIYIYKIKATFNNGAETLLSDGLEVRY